MFDFEAATGLTQENVERMARERDAARCDCGASASDHPGICEACYQDAMCEEPA